VVTGSGQWYRSGAGLAALRWVWVHDCSGTHRDEYFFTTAVDWTAAQVIEPYTGRWNIETTFEEMRSCLGLETTRGWSAPTVSRVAPCLFGLYTVAVVLYVGLPRYRRLGVGVLWPGKQDATFSDALMAVRRWLWVEWVFAIPGHGSAPIEQLVLDQIQQLGRNPQLLHQVLAGVGRAKCGGCWPRSAPGRCKALFGRSAHAAGG
jgi:hypothetical protein